MGCYMVDSAACRVQATYTHLSQLRGIVSVGDGAGGAAIAKMLDRAETRVWACSHAGMRVAGDVGG
jgi:hypothetical protein